MKGVGVLLPVASLPTGKFKDGYAFVDFLAKNKYDFWEVLPLNPRDFFGSPYNSPDSLAVALEYGPEKEWFKLKKYANNCGVKIIGDLPFFVSIDSREYWQNKDLFLVNRYSGAPADNYTKKGQWWGHPQYDWQKLEETGFAFLFERIERATTLFDIVRLDHFRGYDAVWSIPGPYRSGRKGSWLKVPGDKILKLVKKRFSRYPFFAEDLGAITPEVEALRRRFDFPGSRVAVFEASSEKDVVYYTSNHDSSTLIGAFGKRRAREVLNEVLASKAEVKIISVQDLLRLGNEARLNRPGRRSGNWSWKLPKSYIDILY